MNAYDPNCGPVPEVWLGMDEGERAALIAAYHRDAGIELPNDMLHAVIHCGVENQVAMGDDDGVPARETLERLMGEGLDRHDAVHAIGSVLARHLFGVMQEGGKEFDGVSYSAELKSLSAAAYSAEGGEREW